MCKACIQLRKQMLLMDYTSGKLAQRIGRSQGYVSQILCGHVLPDLSDMLGIATVLDIPPQEWAQYFAPTEMRELAARKIKERRKNREKTEKGSLPNSFAASYGPERYPTSVADR